MASLKAEKPVGTHLFGQVKKEPAIKASEDASKAAASKPVSNKKSAQKPQQTKKKGKGGKTATKH